MRLVQIDPSRQWPASVDGRDQVILPRAQGAAADAPIPSEDEDLLDDHRPPDVGQLKADEGDQRDVAFFKAMPATTLSFSPFDQAVLM